MEPRALRRATLAVVLGAAALAGVVWWTRFRLGSPRAIPSSVHAPEGVRIKVEVVNGTRTRGLARRATFLLRDAGFDVVRFASDTGQRDSTVVLDRSGHPEWTALVAKALGGAHVGTRPDSLRYLDVTVVIGRDWRPPAQPFYP